MNEWLNELREAKRKEVNKRWIQMDLDGNSQRSGLWLLLPTRLLVFSTFLCGAAGAINDQVWLFERDNEGEGRESQPIPLTFVLASNKIIKRLSCLILREPSRILVDNVNASHRAHSACFIIQGISKTLGLLFRIYSFIPPTPVPIVGVVYCSAPSM